MLEEISQDAVRENNCRQERLRDLSLRNRYTTELNRVVCGDEWVAPNFYLLFKYRCHVNLEICGVISAVKYLYKNIYEGPGYAHINIVSDAQKTEQQEVDEIKQHLDTRCECAPESIQRI